jgi:GNAT superfamily N-acetyltransferase
MFLARPQLGFVRIFYEGDRPVGVCVVTYAISISVGVVVAKLNDVFVTSPRQGEGIGSHLMGQLKSELRSLGIARSDTSVLLENSSARRFYLRNGFRLLNEERLSCLLG